MRNWDELAAPWLKHEQVMEAAHRPVLDAMLAKAGLSSGQSALDIGIGSGLSSVLAVEAVGPAGRVTGVDIAPPFVARAASRVPAGVTVIEADAQTHGFASETFDAAISIFGTMFFGDTIAAFANIRRAMRPGARFVFACWGPPADNPWLTLSTRISNEVLGPPAEAPDPAAPGPFRFADPDRPQKALTAAGWSASYETVSLKLTPLGAPGEIATVQMELGPAARRVTEEAATEAQTADIHARLTAAYEAFRTAEGDVQVPARVHLFEAVAGQG